MIKNYIELRINREFGDIITDYFDFFKQNIKKFTNTFISYNGIFFIGIVITSYVLVSGILGLIASNENASFLGAVSNDDDTYWMIFFIGMGLYFIIFVILGVLNYGLATSFMILYDKDPTNAFTKKDIWLYFKGNIGKSVLFVLLLVAIYFGFLIISVLFALIPILGMFAQYILQFFLASWLGVSFFEMLQNNKGVVESLGEGWNLVTKSFWKSVGVNLVMGLLITILLGLASFVPGVIFGVYTFHVVENEVSLTSNVVATVIYTLSLSLFLGIMIYGQSLSQLVNGFLYYTLHEKTYNTNTRKRIEQIGEHLDA
ncbi:hypothetical protein [Croceivirga sp. JEA036]|uniref:hypothetical protein n=1 Tax=Croceivirga sp. JEA036 TaxID=2721162 RepID=UPI0014394557|nr:hypothetical protein [Croceivirga sp. JEA036]NJB34981.1 hypothetical protein [Croceivirga sp. JEA036]